ncbi:PQQ-dependent sugar dehydrogenase [Tomitella gaofuii]|uniref:PQQ-dependent sugar dehydrogenase n=1 Tax=Tomitella gaofuii TaxID=2760083 RepID=UPI0015F95306|nr:PQQ-dependent sugar dehydrogenase [Tomitella gaofuii]
MTALHRRPLAATALISLAAVVGCAGPDDPAAGMPSAPGSAASSGTIGPSGSGDTPAEPGPLTGTAVDVATGLDAPWSIVFLGRTPLVSERDSGRIREVARDGSSRTIGVVADVDHGGEGGVLGLAVDGRDRLYVYSTGADGNRIQRFEVTGQPGQLVLGALETILDGLPSARVHNGGRIAFGPDGMLYAGVGDAGDRSDAQDLESLGGKILRMTPDGAVAAGNPFPGSLVYSYGHRNVQGIDWAADGTMFASEFGQNTWDELNIIEPGGNYGWPIVEGIAGGDEFIDPVQQWRPAKASPSGIDVIDGTVFIANLRGEVLRAVPVAAPDTARDFFTSEYGRIRDVALSPDRTLWFLTNNTDGRGTARPGDDRIVAVDAGLPD